MAKSMSASQAASVAAKAPAEAPTISNEHKSYRSWRAVIAPACHCKDTSAKRGRGWGKREILALCQQDRGGPERLLSHVQHHALSKNEPGGIVWIHKTPLSTLYRSFMFYWDYIYPNPSPEITPALTHRNMPVVQIVSCWDQFVYPSYDIWRTQTCRTRAEVVATSCVAHSSRFHSNLPQLHSYAST